MITHANQLFARNSKATPSQTTIEVAMLVASLDALIVAAQRREHSAGSAISVLEAKERLMLAARSAEMTLAAHNQQGGGA